MSEPKFTIDQLKKITQVYYHESCPDGSASAIICAAAFHSLGIWPHFTSIQYSTERMRKLEAKPGQLFVDITPPQERWQEWSAVDPIVLDHHETAKKITEGLNGVYETNDRHSGAMIALEQVFNITPAKTQQNAWVVESLADLAMIRDTWKKDHISWRDACASAMALMFEGSKDLVNRALESGNDSVDLEKLIYLGRKILENNDRRVEMFSRSCHREVFDSPKGSLKASFFNCTEKLMSDVANHLIDNGDDISVGFFYLQEEGQNKVSVSIRTNGKIAANKIAIKFRNGGGHERAAGFRMDEGDLIAPYNIYQAISGVIRSI